LVLVSSFSSVFQALLITEKVQNFSLNTVQSNNKTVYLSDKQIFVLNKVVTNFQMPAVLVLNHLDSYQDVPKWTAGKTQHKMMLLLPMFMCDTQHKHTKLCRQKENNLKHRHSPGFKPQIHF
jgi:GTP1/Obg family GTP-binding protein